MVASDLPTLSTNIQLAGIISQASPSQWSAQCHDISLQGSGEATSVSWPERAPQRSASVSHAVQNTHAAPQQQAGEQLDRNAVATQSTAPAFPGMWYPQGKSDLASPTQLSFPCITASCSSQWHAASML